MSIELSLYLQMFVHTNLSDVQICYEMRIQSHAHTSPIIYINDFTPSKDDNTTHT